MPSERWYPTDGLTGARNTIDVAHTKVHDGKSYSVHHLVSHGAGTACTLMFTTPATPEVHFGFAVQASSYESVQFEEDAYASAGTAITVLNKDRDSTNTTDVAVAHTVTYQCAGTVIDYALLTSTVSGIGVVGGLGNSGQEWILKASKRYLIRCSAQAAATTVIVKAWWYEV